MSEAVMLVLLLAVLLELFDSLVVVVMVLLTGTVPEAGAV
jgi:uncharacterized membrane protein YdfJ with MMPL/SSD domain